MSSKPMRLLSFATLGAVLLLGCNEQPVSLFDRDQIPPSAVVNKFLGDTLLVAQGVQFDVDAADNLGLKSISVTMEGGYAGQLDTAFTSAVTEHKFRINVVLPANTTAGGNILITATAIDGADNITTAVDSIFLSNPDALLLTILAPAAGSIGSPGRQVPVQIEASQAAGITRVGYTVTGVVTDADSVDFTGFPITALYDSVLAVPAGTPDGIFTIVAFAEDSAGRRAVSAPRDVTVQSVLNDTDPPVVTFDVAPRVEVDDEITVTATDPSGITELGWWGIDAATGDTIGGGSTTGLSGVLTSVTQIYTLNFVVTSFPTKVAIVAYAVDGAGNRGESTQQPSPSPIVVAPSIAAAVGAQALAQNDTVIVVDGTTVPLPSGGTVIDAIYNANLDELYLTNVDLNHIEVFDVATSTFGTPIPVGSEPWGIALWPNDTLGTNADTVVVANSGGTNLSIVDLQARREVRRHELPNFLIQTINTTLDPVTVTLQLEIREFDFSDRPQYLGMVCRPPGTIAVPTGATNCAADSIFAVYSTTPTPGQTDPFENKASVRWENITAGAATPHSHFFWEHAQSAIRVSTDSLRVFIDRGPCDIGDPRTACGALPVGVLPIDTSLSVALGITVTLEELGFQQTTFVRNSGNFTRAIVGEGDNITLARAIGYNAISNLINSVNTAQIGPNPPGTMVTGPSEVDLGISPGIRVRDFIANTATKIKSVAINFNGFTNLVRADSVYVLDRNLRLAGLVPVGGANPGMDLVFDHAFDPFVGGTAGTFGGTMDPNNRLLFLAREDANLDVYDTFFFEQVTSVPIRDPVIGPLRVSENAAGTQQVVAGITASGIVVVRLPTITNIFPSTR